MSNQLSVKEAERSVLRFYQKDGLLDILLGLFFVIMALGDKLTGFGLPEEYSAVPALAYLAVGLVAYTLLKNRVVAPRVGLVKVGPMRNRQKRRLLFVAIALNGVTLAILLLASSGWLGSALSGSPPWLVDAFFGLLIFGFFAFMAYTVDTPRFAFYGVLLGIAPVLGTMLRAKGETFESGSYLLAGAAMTLAGAYIFVNFLKENPVAPGEAEGA